jgi:hypothetical protein
MIGQQQIEKASDKLTNADRSYAILEHANSSGVMP